MKSIDTCIEWALAQSSHNPPMADIILRIKPGQEDLQEVVAKLPEGEKLGSAHVHGSTMGAVVFCSASRGAIELLQDFSGVISLTSDQHPNDCPHRHHADRILAQIESDPEQFTKSIVESLSNDTRLLEALEAGRLEVPDSCLSPMSAPASTLIRVSKQDGYFDYHLGQPEATKEPLTIVYREQDGIAEFAEGFDPNTRIGTSLMSMFRLGGTIFKARHELSTTIGENDSSYLTEIKTKSGAKWMLNPSTSVWQLNSR